MTTTQHGTRSRYAKGCRCPQCRAATAAYSAQLVARRVAQGAIPTVHGLSTYNNFRCRCDVCRAAMASYQRTRRAAR